MSIRIPLDFDLAQTLYCGQAFRWKQRDDGIWEGIALGKYLSLKQEDDALILDCSQQEFDTLWKNYFDLDTDYASIRKTLSDMDPVLKEASEYAPGIRILRQDPWEALCSFIISQNNNIPRIKGIIQRLCELLGEKTENGYLFPDCEKVANCTAEDLAPIRSGFRAKYIISAARTLSDNPDFVKSVTDAPIDEARKLLQTIKGVGPKVSDCALLYGFHRMECFPMDVWMKRAMAVLLPDRTPEEFGTNAGIAQQYIFHYSRMHPDLFKDE